MLFYCLLKKNVIFNLYKMENLERKKRFDSYVSSKALEGYIIVDKNTENLTAVLKKEAEEFNNTIHIILTCLTCFWVFVWWYLYSKAKKNSIIRVSIDDSGNLVEEEVKK